MWTCANASDRGPVTDINDPDVPPTAVQGPKAKIYVVSISGDWVRDMKHVWFANTGIGGIALDIQSSGYSKQRGFALHLMDGTRGTVPCNIAQDSE